MNQNSIIYLCSSVKEKHQREFIKAFEANLFGFEKAFVELQQSVFINRVRSEVMENINRDEATVDERNYYVGVLDKCILKCMEESENFISKLDII